MKEWSAARERVQEVKAKNAEEGEKMSKEITSVSSLYTSPLHWSCRVEQSVWCVTVCPSVFETNNTTETIVTYVVEAAMAADAST